MKREDDGNQTRQNDLLLEPSMQDQLDRICYQELHY